MLHGLLVFTQHGMGMKDAAPWKSDGSVTGGLLYAGLWVGIAGCSHLSVGMLA